MKPSRHPLLATMLLLGTVALAACGSDSSTDDSDTAKSGLDSKTEEAIEAAYTGTYGEPPTSSPAPEPGKNIWLITLSPSLGAPDELVDAAKLLDWDVTVFDAKFTPDLAVSGLRQAVADNADGIIVSYADCATIVAGLKDVAKANIPVVNIESIDCDVEIADDGTLKPTGQPGLFDAEVGYNNPDDPEKPLTFAEVWAVFAEYQGLGLIDGTQGSGKIIVLSETDIKLNLVGLRSLKATLKEYCPDCEIVQEVEFVGTDFGQKLQDKVSQALVQNPDADAIYGMYDAPSLDVATAVVTSGRKDDIYVMAGEGTAPIIELIHEDRGVNAGVGFSVAWEHYAALDAVNRLLHGEEPNGAAFPSGVGVQLFTKDRNLPSKGDRFSGDIDFRAAYLKAWGVD